MCPIEALLPGPGFNVANDILTSEAFDIVLQLFVKYVNDI